MNFLVIYKQGVLVSCLFLFQILVCRLSLINVIFKYIYYIVSYQCECISLFLNKKKMYDAL